MRPTDENPEMDAVRLGSALRALRRMRGWTQADVAKRARVSQSAVSRGERGEALSLTGRNLKAIAEALGARYDPRVVWQGEGLDRLLDAAHAGLVERVVEVLRENEWQVVPEATFNIYGERGSIDILAFHPESGSLLIVEVKSVVPDMQGLLASMDRKDRLGPRIAAAHGWDPRSISRLIVLPEDRTGGGVSPSTEQRSTPHIPIGPSRFADGSANRAVGSRVSSSSRVRSEPHAGIGSGHAVPASRPPSGRSPVPPLPRARAPTRRTGGRPPRAP